MPLGWLAVLGCQLLLAAHLIPDFSEAFSLQRHQDSPPLAYQMSEARAFLLARGALWGYHPNMGGGYADPFLWTSNVFLQLLAVALWPVAPLRLMVVVRNGLVLLGPAVFWLAGRRLGLAGRDAAALTLLMTLVTLGSQGLHFLGAAMPMAFLVTVATVGVYAEFLAWLEGRSRGWGMLAGMALPLFHKSAVVLALPFAVALWTHRRSLTLRRWGILGGLVAGTLLVNAFWLLPAQRYASEIDFQYNAFFRDLLQLHFMELLLLVPGAWLLRGALAWMAWQGTRPELPFWREREATRRALRLNLPAMLGMMVVGGFVPGFHSSRYMYATELLACLAAGVYLAQGDWRGLLARWRRGRPRWQVLGAVAAVAGVFWWGTYRRLFEFHARPDGQIVCGFIDATSILPLDDLRGVAEWLKANHDGGRVFLEQSKATNMLSTTLLDWTGLPMINAPCAEVFLRQNHGPWQLQQLLTPSMPERRSMMGIKAGQAHKPEDFPALAETYNVRWFVLADPSLIEALDDPALALVHREGRFVIYKREVEPSWTLRGEADVTFDHSGITLENIRPDPETGDVVLSFNWSPGLVASDGSPVAPWETEFAPRGLIRLPAPKGTSLKVGL